MLAATFTTLRRVFSGDVSLRRQPIPVLRAGAGGGAVALRLVYRGHDGCAAFLREADQAPHSAAAKALRTARSRRNPRGRQRFNAWFNRSFTRFLDTVRTARAAVAPTARPDGDRASWRSFWRASCCIRSSAWPISRAPIRASSSSTSRRRPARRIEVTEAGGRTSRGADPSRSSIPTICELIVSNIGVTPGFLVDLHEQCRPAHRLRPGRPDRRSPASAATSTWTACARAIAPRNAANHRLFPVGRHGRRRAQSRPARADRRAGERLESRSGVRSGAEIRAARFARCPA